jgi:hypothetical protein
MTLSSATRYTCATQHVQLVCVFPDHADLQMDFCQEKKLQRASGSTTRLRYLVSRADRADAVVARVAEGSDPRDGTVPLEREEVLPGAGDEAAVVRDERGREGTGSPRRRRSCVQGEINRQRRVGGGIDDQLIMSPRQESRTARCRTIRTGRGD